MVYAFEITILKYGCQVKKQNKLWHLLKNYKILLILIAFLLKRLYYIIVKEC